VNLQDEMTAAVPNPGARPPAAEPPGPGSMALPISDKQDVRTASVRVNPSSMPRMDPAMAPISRQPGGDAPPEMDTAYVPLPGAPGGSSAALTKAQTQVPLSGRATIIAQAQTRPSLLSSLPAVARLVEKVRASKYGGMILISVCGCLGIALVLVFLGPRRQQNLPPPTAIAADPGPPVDTRPPPPTKEPDENIDPAKVKEKDALLERAILSFESGKPDEALALFRRYSEEDPSPAAEFMVQLLQNQQSQNEKDH
jgi:hypothetical protein